jgi:hypothetical protein
MTAAPLRPSPDSALAFACLFRSWLARACAGERVIYHRGHLTWDRSPASALTGPERQALARIADMAFAAAQEGQVLLVQRRHGPFDFSYLAIKASRGSGAMALAPVRPLPAAA